MWERTDMALREQLLDFVEEKIKSAHLSVEGELRDDTSLLKSGLLDSLAVLQLATWIDQHMDSSTDLGEINMRDTWDTIGDIVRFIERNQKRQGKLPQANLKKS